MRKRILSVLLTLVLALSVVLGITLFASAEGEKTGITAGQINVAENVKMTVAITAPEGATKMTVTVPGKEPVTVAVAATYTAEIAIKDIAQDLTIAFANDADEPIACDDSAYSVVDYITDYTTATDSEITGAADYEKLKALALALEIYGRAAKAYFAGETMPTDVPAITDASIAAAAASGTLPEGLTHEAITLILESETTIRHYFTVAAGKEVSDYVFYVDLDNGNDCDPAEVLTPVAKGDEYYVEIEGITPNDLDTPYTLCVGEYKYTYSALNYVNNKKDNATPVATLVAALYNYNKIASALTGTVTFKGGHEDGQGGGNYGTLPTIENITYEYGVTEPIVVESPVPNHPLLRFAGWYDANGNKVTEITPSMTGDITLYAWYALFDDVIFDLSEQADSYWLYGMCFEHKDANADKECDMCGRCMICACETPVDEATDGVCDTCGFKTAKCAAYDPAATEACADCGYTGKTISENNAQYVASDKSTKYRYIQAVGTAVTGNTSTVPEGYWLKDGKLMIMTCNRQDKTKVYTQFGVGFSDPIYNVTNLSAIGITHVKPYYKIRAYDAKKDSITTSDWLATALFDYSKTTVKQSWMLFGTGSSANANNSPTTGAHIRGDSTITTTGLTKTATYTLRPDLKSGNYGAAIATRIPWLYNGSVNTNTVYENNRLGMSVFENFTITATYNSTLKAPANNEIVYEADVVIPEGGAKNYTSGTVTQLPATATLAGIEAIFVGWYADEALTQPIKEIPANSVGNVNVYAKWKTPDKIVYHTNCDDVIASEDYVAGETTLNTAITKEYYTFAGWYANEAFEGEALETVPAGTSEILHVYAKWVEGDYIFYHANGGTPAPAVTTYVAGETLLAADVEKLGFNFGGWYTESVCINKVEGTVVPAGTTGHYNLYANWVSTTGCEVIWETDPVTWEDQPQASALQQPGIGDFVYENEKTYTISFDIAKLENNADVGANIGLYLSNSSGATITTLMGSSLNPTEVYFLSGSSSSAKGRLTLSTEFQTLYFVFKGDSDTSDATVDGWVKVYGETGTLLASSEWNVNTEEIGKYYFRFLADGHDYSAGGAITQETINLRTNGIFLYEGDAHPAAN